MPLRITLNGSLGSGKSTVGKRLASILGIRHISAGDLFREIGRISNLDALRTNLAAEENFDIDRQVDERTRVLAISDESFVIDSRMAWHFVANAFNVFLSASDETAVARIHGDKSRRDESYGSLAEAKEGIAARRESENRRYSRLYGVNIEDAANYHAHIITDDARVDAIVELILALQRLGRKGERWVPKSRVVPMKSQGIVKISANELEKAPRADMGDGRIFQMMVEENFAYSYAGDDELAALFRHVGDFVSYRTAPIPGVTKAGNSMQSQARATLKAADLQMWEQLAGVNLAFVSRLTA
jgi:predicted cytidylate kinase